MNEGRPTLTPEEERRFLRAARRADPSTRALCELLFFTGCRLSEALALTIDHIDTHQGFVVFRTLKQRDHAPLRAVPIPSGLVRRLLGLPRHASGRLWLFSRWTARRRLLAVYAEAELSPEHATSRVFRHSYNARAMQTGLPVAVRCSLLGHRTQAANAHYGRLHIRTLRRFARLVWSG